MSSGYKAVEYSTYLYGLCPSLLRHILPHDFWQNYCRFVAGMRLIRPFSMHRSDIIEEVEHLLRFTREFELLYCQRNPNRLHFVRQSIHLLSHLGPDTLRLGPLACYSQYALENLIGNIGKEIRSLVHAYENLAQRGILCVQTNCVQAMFPHIVLDDEKALPTGAMDIGDGFAFLRVRDETPYNMSAAEAEALCVHWEQSTWPDIHFANQGVIRWGRLRLPNAQTVCSSYSEGRLKRTDK